MEKHSIQMIINDLRSRRDALSLAHENLKIESDNWNKCVIVTSLMTGMFESIKLRMGWNSNVVDLVPIALSSIIACISALIKFKKFPLTNGNITTIPITLNPYTYQRKKRRRNNTLTNERIP